MTASRSRRAVRGELPPLDGDLRPVELARRALRDGDPAQALTVLEDLPDHPWTLLWRAKALQGLDRKNEAARSAEDALAIEPTFAPALWYLLCDAEADADRLRVAEQLATGQASNQPLLREALLLARKIGDGPTVCALARALAAGNPDAVSVEVLVTILDDLDDTQVRLELLKQVGQACFQQGQFARATTLFAEAVEALPRQPWRWVWLSRAQLKIGDTESATASARRANELKPGWPPATWQLVDALDAQGKRPEALELLCGLTTPELELADARKLLRRARDWKEPKLLLEAADSLLQHGPDSEAVTSKALALWELGDRDGARRVASREDPANRARLLAELALRNDDPSSAWWALREQHLTRQDCRLLIRVGHSLRRYGWVSEALAAYRAATACDPIDAVAHNALEIAEAEASVLRGRTAPAPTRPPTPRTRGRVLHVVAQSLPETQTGYTLRTHYLCRAQQEAGLEPIVCTQLGFPEAAGAAAVDVVDGVRYVRLGHGRDTPRRLDQRLDETVNELVELIEEFQPAVLHAASDYRNALAALTAGRATGVPVVYEVRGFWEETRLAKQGEGAEHRECYGLHRERETQCMLLADRVVTLAEVMKHQIAARGVPIQNISVIPNAVDVEKFYPVPRDAELAASLGIGPKDAVIGYISSFASYEGIHYLIRATQLLLSQGLNVRCLLVGDGVEMGALEEEAARCGVTDAVIFTGRIPHDDILRYYGIIDVFVVPRTNDSVSHLVTPLKPFEAMATARPTVVSDVAALSEIITDGETGRVFRAEDPVHLAEVITELLEEHDGRRRLGERGRAWVLANRTWDRNGERYQSLYRELDAI